MAVSSFARFKGGFPTPQQEDGVALVDGLEELLREPAEAITRGLASRGIELDAPEWQDFMYEIRCTVKDRNYAVWFSFDYVGWEWFELSYNPTLGFFSKLFGKNEAKEMTQLSSALNSVLREISGITEVRWYEKPMGNPDYGYGTARRCNVRSWPRL